ncbi:Hypothetical predicted protein [Pelobates cultripes]|uniref:Uncharacterized protein n=1 Tax=Pelobates cultripes TaxID=61616 RepID=A0AAD1TQS0_PELCU|nr:Hypothetical predicted protein [Pelobates cultripes]
MTNSGKPKIQLEGLTSPTPKANGYRNIRLRGIPEQEGGEALLQFVQTLINSMGFKGPAETPHIMSAFRVCKSAAAPAETPRDVAVRTAMMNRSRALGTVQFKGCS